jgi:hypothetical protein
MIAIARAEDLRSPEQNDRERSVKKRRSANAVACRVQLLCATASNARPHVVAERTRAPLCRAAATREDEGDNRAEWSGRVASFADATIPGNRALSARITRVDTKGTVAICRRRYFATSQNTRHFAPVSFHF